VHSSDAHCFLQRSWVSMDNTILQQVGQWLAVHTLDDLIENSSSPDITAWRLWILHFIEKRDIHDSERIMWGLLHTYNEIFTEANVLLYFKRISGVIFMGGEMCNVLFGDGRFYMTGCKFSVAGVFPNLHKFWEMIVGNKIFSSQWRLSRPEVHPEVRALLKTQMTLLLESVGLTRNEALIMIEINWREELRMEENYHYGHYWETPCRFVHRRRPSLRGPDIYGRIWDAAEDMCYARVRRIYEEEILGKAKTKANLDPTPKELKFGVPPREYEPAGIDANGDWFNVDAESSAQELWKILESKNEWPGWDEAQKYCNLEERDLSIKIPLIPKK